MGKKHEEAHDPGANAQQNRRLRHLHGVSLRNLNLSPVSSRLRGKTITDDEYNLKTTAKAVQNEEARTLHHAKSYDQLSKPEGAPLQNAPRAATANERTGKGLQRPARGNMRRRSTLHWATSNPRARQDKLEAVEVYRMVTSWFSVHHDELEQPIYISEVMQNSMNPSFSFFDLDMSNASVARSDHFKLRIWSKTEHMDDYRILLELDINLRSLQFVGRSLENFHHPLPENCVLLHLSDGIYTSFTELPAEVQHQPPLTAAMKATTPVQAASFDALLKLANLDDVIQDALHTRSKLEADINKLLAEMPSAENALSRLSLQREDTRTAERAREAEQKNLENATKAKSELQSSLRSRRKVVETLPGSQKGTQDRCKKLDAELQKVQKELGTLEVVSQGQVRRISTSLLHIFPIEPIKNKALQFTIRSIHLPNSAFSDTNRDEIVAALGYTAQLVYQISLYLSIPLPYPVEPNESSPFIRDDISAGIAQRVFLLQPSGATYKFEYGVFLLNKDIEFLMNRSGLRMMDIRHTLPNLKYLMFVLTAGSAELPARKAGGIRGLLRGRLTPNISRRNSEESVSSQTSTSLAQQEKMDDMDDLSNGPVRAKALPYRRSMLRDAG
ncbi:hypothetical protein PMZ80_008404 [Knufia obscura]|uniref:UV radiation resistance-associated gene protein n=1 Tax=Knufia obscura TaxID=1635080 RepID=A0ABR0REQ3_9EURO|nr:hypothetical protein PMZ80_008404 [Knufia obscura]